MNLGSCWISAANYSVLLCATETHNPFYPIIIHISEKSNRKWQQEWMLGKEIQIGITVG